LMYGVLLFGSGANVALLAVGCLRRQVLCACQFGFRQIVFAREIERLKHTPMAHGAIGIETDGFLKCTQRFVIPEAMNQRQPLIEPLLGLWRFRRDRDMRLPDTIDPLRWRKLSRVDMFGLRRPVLVRLRRGNQTAEQKSYREPQSVLQWLEVGRKNRTENSHYLVTTG